MEGNFKRKQIKYKNIFDGIVNYIKFNSSVRPSYVNNKILNTCIKNSGYTWIELFPIRDNYVMTIMLDNNNKIIQWYIDISKKVCAYSYIAYQDDLYLDIVITPDGKEYILDIDELNYALQKKEISKQEYNFAFKTLKRVEKIYISDFNILLDLTNYLLKEFN